MNLAGVFGSRWGSARPSADGFQVRSAGLSSSINESNFKPRSLLVWFLAAVIPLAIFCGERRETAPASTMGLNDLDAAPASRPIRRILRDLSFWSLLRWEDGSTHRPQCPWALSRIAE